jgi:hypothetical protein
MYVYTAYRIWSIFFNRKECFSYFSPLLTHISGPVSRIVGTYTDLESMHLRLRCRVSDFFQLTILGYRGCTGQGILR